MTRLEFAAAELSAFYQTRGKLPDIVAMHPVFRRAIEREQPQMFGLSNPCDGRVDTFMGCKVVSDSAIHSCQWRHSRDHQSD